MTTDIQQARNVLGKRRDGTTPGAWQVNRPTQEILGQQGLAYVGDVNLLSDLRLIVGTAGNPELLDALNGLLHHVWKYPAWSSGHMRTYAERIAAAIIAADERMSA